MPNPKDTPAGLPPDHPSIGKSLRDAVRGPSWPEMRHHGGDRIINAPLEIIWTVALAAWVVYSRLFYICPYLNDPNAARLAFGVAQRLQGVAFQNGIFHQLPKQEGFYLLFELLARIFRIDAAGLEHFMAISCAVLMIGIIALSFHLGYMIWGRRVALVSTTLLSISPMMWITGEYPTVLVPALFFFLLATWAMVLSYRVKGGRLWLIISALLFAWSVLVQFEMILGFLAPICYAWFVDRRGLRRALILYAIWAAALAIVWFAILQFTPFQIFSESIPRHPEYPRSLLMNWWGMGPFLFVFAFAGFVYRFSTDRKPLPFIFFWILGFNTFYTSHLESPAPFIAYYPPVSWLAAFSIIALYGWLARLARFNKPMRLVFMAILIFGALTMLTTSIIKQADGRTIIAWGDTISYGGPHGNYPTGATWYYMQDFRRGRNIEYSWIEDGVRMACEQVFRAESPAFEGGALPTFVGSDSRVFLSYLLMAHGWRFDSSRGPFVLFSTESRRGDPSSPRIILQTAYVDDEFVPELAFLANPGRLRTYLGRDAMPRLALQTGPSGNPALTAMTGWHVAWSFAGLDIVESSAFAGLSDGTLDCEKELTRFFYTDPLPRRHVTLVGSAGNASTSAPSATSPPPSVTSPPSSTASPPPNGAVVIDQDGQVRAQANQPLTLENVSKVTWSCEPEVHQWMAIAVNRIGLLPGYSFSVNGVAFDDGIWLAKDLPGLGMSRWDIFLIPPAYIDRPTCEISLSSPTRGTITSIVWTQRNYPDSQYRDNVAKPLGLEFSDIQVLQ